MIFSINLIHVIISIIFLIILIIAAYEIGRRVHFGSRDKLISKATKSHLDTLKYEFITVITHRFRTPLTQIKWGAEALRAASTESQKEAEFRKIERTADAVISMTDVLMKVADAETDGIELDLEPVHIPEFVRSLASEIDSDFMMKKITPEFSQLSQKPPPVKIDKKQMRLVFETVLENAIIYAPQGGAVHITFREERDYVITEVFDNGIGIPKEELPRIFERFYRGAYARAVDQEGLGIGLYMSRKIVSLHNGSLEIFSEGKGKGTVVLIALPVNALPSKLSGLSSHETQHQTMRPKIEK